ncbi:MAG: SNF2 family DNA or RNA helicase [Saprospiraceae bacterium]|jgi:SNF2 family DNA or RNA helicase
MIAAIKERLEQLLAGDSVSALTSQQGFNLYNNGHIQLLTRTKDKFDFSVDDAFNDFDLSLIFDDKKLHIDKCSCKADAWCSHAVGAAHQLLEELERTSEKHAVVGKKYTRKGMVKRVLAERLQKALSAEYKLEFADNIYGEHRLYNEKGQAYYLTLRDREEKSGYCSCKDYQNNKLGTCKHLLFAFEQIDSGKRRLRKASKQYPFVEIFLDPHKDYQISWYYPNKLSAGVKKLLKEYFGESPHLSNDQVPGFLEFIEKAKKYKQILIRPEVLNVIEKSHDKLLLAAVQEKNKIDFSVVKATLYAYQKKGVEFATFKEGAIIADEMGLGKTLQAITIALAKKAIFGFHKTLVICPASVKDQWKKEIEKFTDEEALVIEGKPEERESQYLTTKAFFTIINYETVLRDYLAINQGDYDFIILDEAQRIKNYSTITAQSIKVLNKKHALVITGTPIENQLTDLYSIVQFLDPKMLTPLWEFSYQHCYFDEKQKNKIVGYYNLQQLKKRLKPLLLRREKRQVLRELPNVTEQTIMVEMSTEQSYYHTNYAKGIAKILSKKYISPYDMQRLMLLMSQMRMVCDSTYLIDESTNVSPKLIELEHILTRKIDLKNSKKKILIFSEWIRMNALIGKMLRKHNIGYVELNGKVPVKKRKNIINTFFENPDCQVFLSTEAGGSGLNLQIADTVVNFELPWNPAKKNQRIGRIDRLGQLSKKLTVLNFVTKDSIETRISDGLLLKQSLFEGVLNKDNALDMVDFSSKGRSQFLKQLEEIINNLEQPEMIPETVSEAYPSDLIPEEVETMIAIGKEAPAEDVSPIANESATQTPQSASGQPQQTQQARQMQEVLTQGMGFLSSLMKMATGQEMQLGSQAIEVDEKTGEVVMRFKLPGTSL